VAAEGARLRDRRNDKSYLRSVAVARGVIRGEKKLGEPLVRGLA